VSTKPIVFISYAHADEPAEPAEGEVKWYHLVRKFLRAAEQRGIFEVWVDREMMGGDDWDKKIKEKLGICNIFVLLVSADSMASSYILGTEIPIIRERQAAGETVHFYPVLLSPTPLAGLEDIKDKNIRPRDMRSLSSFNYHGRREHLVEFANEIERIARHTADQDGSNRGETARTTFTRPKLVHISGLPETAYRSLVGRDVELALLDAAWADPNVNILSLVAEGGVGKSALVNEWLTRLRRDNYRGAEAVLGWSFYSQGSKERATSADQFLDWASQQLGAKAKSNSAEAKGEAIADAMTQRRVLLALDGVEPLQHGPGPQVGQLKDPGLRALLRSFAAEPPASNHGLIVLTTRAEVADVARWKDSSAPVERIERLSDEAGAKLLADNGVKGSDADLRAASRDFAGHPLALSLLASYLRETQRGDVRRRDRIRGLLADADNPGHDHARRVMESYEKEWLAGQPLLLAIMFLVGLFDRPASADCLAALRAKPAIKGLTDDIVGLNNAAWNRTVSRLRDARLLSPEDPSAPGALDAHPLVREWFGERLRQTNKAAWKAAHSRLYDHLRDSTHEGKTPKLADLAPLYHAIAHGCRAGRYQEALGMVYMNRICRRLPDGKIEFYTRIILGAPASDLSAVSWFFDQPYETPAAALTPRDRAWVLGVASFALRAQGRLQEALPAMRAGLRITEEARDWENAARGASNLSVTELLFGDVAAAAATSEKAVALSDRADDTFLKMGNRTTQADALLAAGVSEKAADLFADAQRLQRELEPDVPLLYSIAGYRYCDLLLSQGRSGEARDQAAQTIELVRQNNWVLETALDTLTLGRAHLALALQSQAIGASASSLSADARNAAARLDEAGEGLRASGRNDYLAPGLLARAALRCAIGDWDGAARDLDDAQETAEPGPMRLFLCEMALGRARLALARREAFAPLNDLVEKSPPKPSPPDSAEAAALTEDARENLASARKLVEECGYHKHDEELAELEAVLEGKRRFADLPPRV
jgi:tetratricopeptide (TPR) repeat protein